MRRWAQERTDRKTGRQADTCMYVYTHTHPTHKQTLTHTHTHAHTHTHTHTHTYSTYRATTYNLEGLLEVLTFFIQSKFTYLFSVWSRPSCFHTISCRAEKEKTTWSASSAQCRHGYIQLLELWNIDLYFGKQTTTTQEQRSTATELKPKLQNVFFFSSST